MKKNYYRLWPLLIPFFGLLVVGISAYNGFVARNKMALDIKERALNGKVISFSREQKGFYTMYIKDEISNSSLRYSGFLLSYKMQTGDSVSKKQGDLKISFYQNENGKYVKMEEASPF